MEPGESDGASEMEFETTTDRNLVDFMEFEIREKGTNGVSLRLALRVVGTALETALNRSVDRIVDGVTTLICVTRSIECPWARCMTASLRSTS